MRCHCLLLSLLCVLPLGRTQAQRGNARIEGTVFDSLRFRGLDSAVVLIRHVETDIGYTALAGADGGYHVDTLPAGHYRITFTHPVLDSLDLFPPVIEVELSERGLAVQAFAIPSGVSIRARSCPGMELAKAYGVLRGRLTDADGDRPLSGAHVSIEWSELRVDSSAHAVSSTQRGADVMTDAAGFYRFCGVPTQEIISAQATLGADTSGVVGVTVPRDAGLAILPLMLDTTSAHRRIAETHMGTAILRGVVRSSTGQPIPDAQVHVADTPTAARTDSAGRFQLSSLPAGSQQLEVRMLGYREMDVPVTLHSHSTDWVDVRLTRLVTLDSIRVIGQRLKYAEFEDHRSKYFMGTFHDEAWIRTHIIGPNVMDLFSAMPGAEISGQGTQAKLNFTRAPASCAQGVQFVVDGVLTPNLDGLSPLQIGAVEIYKPGHQSPPPYMNYCGLIIVHTKRG